MTILSDFSDFTVKQLKARTAWLEKAAAVRDGKAKESLLAQREIVLSELAKREA